MDPSPDSPAARSALDHRTPVARPSRAARRAVAAVVVIVTGLLGTALPAVAQTTPAPGQPAAPVTPVTPVTPATPATPASTTTKPGPTPTTVPAPTTTAKPPLPIAAAPATTGAPTTTTVRAVTPAPTTAPASYRMPAAVAALLNGALHIPVGGADIAATKAGSVVSFTVAAPSAPPIKLPNGAPALSFGPSTVAVDTATDTLTLRSSAAATNGAGGAFELTVRHVSAPTNTNPATTPATNDVSLTVDLTAVPVFATTVDLHGALAYKNGAFSGALTGTLGSDAVVTPGGLTFAKGSTFTLSTTDGFSVNATALIGAAPEVLTVAVAGAITDLRNWSLTVTTTRGRAWQPTPTLSIDPNFSGTITSAAGVVAFDLKATAPFTWSPRGDLSFAVTAVEISNTAPPKALPCPSDIVDRTLWIDLGGRLTITPGGDASAAFSIDAQACFAPAAKTFTVTSTTGGSLPLGAASLSDVAITLNGNLATRVYSLNGTAKLTIPGARTSFTTALVLQSDGALVAAVRANVADAGVPGGGSGTIYVATKDEANFDPATIPGFKGDKPFDLVRGVNATFNYTLPADVAQALNRFGLGNRTSALAVATLGPNGFTLKAAIDLGTGVNGARLFQIKDTKMYLNRVGISLTATTGSTAVALTGTGTLALAKMSPNGAPSTVQVNVSSSFDVKSTTFQIGFSLAATCAAKPCTWTDAFGIPGLSVETVGGSFGITFGSGIPTPSVAMSATGIGLPQTWANALGIQNGTRFSFNVNINAASPLIEIAMDGPGGGPALKPLAIASKDQAVVDSLTVNHAVVAIAPFGATTAAGRTVRPGVTVSFAATIAGVNAKIDAAFDVTALKLDAEIYVDDVTVGTVKLEHTMLDFHVSPTSFEIAFEGGYSDIKSRTSMMIKVRLKTTTSMLNAAIAVDVTAGPSEIASFTGHLDGAIAINANVVTFSASGTGALMVGAQSIGSLTFTFTSGNGMSWTQVLAGAQQIAQAFKDGFGWLDSSTARGLQMMGVSATDSARAIATTYNDTSAQVAAAFTKIGTDVTTIGAALRNGLNATDQQVADALYKAGFTPEQITATLQSVFGETQAQAVAALQSIGVQGKALIDTIAKFFGGNGAYTISTTHPFPGVPLFLDVEGQSNSNNARVLQWTWNGQRNQQWYVVPTSGGYGLLINRNSGKCLTISDNRVGSKVTQFDCLAGAQNQEWSVGLNPGDTNMAGRTVVLRNRFSGFVLDVTGGSGSAGTQLEQWYRTNDWNQQFTFTAAAF